MPKPILSNGIDRPCRTVIFRCFSPTVRESITSKPLTAKVGSGFPAPNGWKVPISLMSLRCHLGQRTSASTCNVGTAGAPLGPFRHDSRKPVTKLVEPRLPHRHSGRAGMSAEGAPARSRQAAKPLIQIESSDCPCRAFADTLLIDGNDNRRPMKPLHQAGGGDPDHAHDASAGRPGPARPAIPAPSPPRLPPT